MDIYDSALTQSQPEKQAESSQQSSENAQQSQSQSSQSQSHAPSQSQSPTLEQEVQQLVGGIASWWSGVSKKSQESLSQAQSHIQSQGGILNLARKELSHFENQISQAQLKAREESLKSPSTKEEGQNSKSSDVQVQEKEIRTLADEEKGKGKGKAKASPQVETEEVSPQSSSTENPLQVQSTTGIYDVNSPAGFQPGDSPLNLDFEKSKELALKEAKKAADFTSDFFNKFSRETSPKLINFGKSLQESLNKNFVSIRNSNSGKVGDEGGKERAGEGDSDEESKNKEPTNLFSNPTLHSLTETFSQTFPQLDLEKSQSLAMRYLKIGEKSIVDAGKEMNGLLGDLIKIVPEEKVGEEDLLRDLKGGKELKNENGNGNGNEEKEKEVNDGVEEVFDWDEDQTEGKESERENRDGKREREQKQVDQVEATTRPETGNLTLDEKDDGKVPKTNLEDEDDDDDWE